MQSTEQLRMIDLHIFRLNGMANPYTGLSRWAITNAKSPFATCSTSRNQAH